jgi:hypothetical protein
MGAFSNDLRPDFVMPAPSPPPQMSQPVEAMVQAQKTGETNAQTSRTSSGSAGELHYLKMGMHLGLQLHELRDHDTMQKIQRIAAMIGEESEPEEMVWKLRKIQTHLGPPHWSMTSVEQIYNYLRLQDQRSTIDRQIQGMEAQGRAVSNLR